MNTLEEDLRTLLLTGGGSPPPLAATGVHWNEMPQAAALPCIVLWVVSMIPDRIMEGPGTIYEARVQCDCKALTYSAAKTLSRVVMGLTDHYAGIIGGTDFQGVFIETGRDGVEPVGGEVAERREVCSLDLMVWFGTTTVDAPAPVGSDLLDEDGLSLLDESDASLVEE